MEQPLNGIFPRKTGETVIPLELEKKVLSYLHKSALLEICKVSKQTAKNIFQEHIREHPEISFIVNKKIMPVLVKINAFDIYTFDSLFPKIGDNTRFRFILNMIQNDCVENINWVIQMTSHPSFSIENDVVLETDMLQIMELVIIHMAPRFPEHNDIEAIKIKNWLYEQIQLYSKYRSKQRYQTVKLLENRFRSGFIARI